MRIYGSINVTINAFIFADIHMKTSAPTLARKATNVTFDAALLAHAKSLHINISQASEEGLARAVAAKRAAIWMEDNQAALESSNSYVDTKGLQQRARCRAACMIGVETLAVPVEEKYLPRRSSRSARHVPRVHSWRYVHEVRQAFVFMKHPQRLAANIGKSIRQALRRRLKKRVALQA